VPLRQSITYANVAISLTDENDQSYVYGYVPIVVAKCGVFLKEKATSIEGIFRLSGSEKRIKELKLIFDSPDRYGKGLIWDGYTVHDAANVLRRYLNDLPEPVVPLDLYEKFRTPLRGATKQSVGDTEGPQFLDSFDEKGAIIKYQQLITELPPLNRQLLLYILDLLAVFAAKADENRMNSQNLAAIFQPGMLSHPNHAMAPDEYRLNQCVIIFLIEKQDNFLIGMHGTAADENTMKEVERGQQPTMATTPVSINVNASGLGRSASNASAGAESVRRDGQIRRNRSTSSRHSRHSRHSRNEQGPTSPTSPITTAPPKSGGLSRSNTVPSKKSPLVHGGGRFQRELRVPHVMHPPMTQGASHSNPSFNELALMQAENSSIISSNPSTAGAATALAPGPCAGPGRSQERLLDPHDAAVPTRERKLPAFFNRSPAGDGEQPRQPNKLRKKRAPGNLPSAASSTTSLPQSTVGSPILDAIPDRGEIPNLNGHEALQPNASSTHAGQSTSDVSSEPTPRASHVPSSNSLVPKGAKSPPVSLHSSFNDGSDLDQIDDQLAQLPDQSDRKRRWRLSRPTRREDGSPTPGVTSPKMSTIGSNNNAEISTLSIGSGSRPRKSFTGDSTDFSALGIDMHQSESKEGDSRGPIGWIRTKYREAKETVEQKRNKSPPAGHWHATTDSLDASVSGDDGHYSHGHHPVATPASVQGPMPQQVPPMSPPPVPQAVSQPQPPTS
jgi:hypothetical protein